MLGYSTLPWKKYEDNYKKIGPWVLSSFWEHAHTKHGQWFFVHCQTWCKSKWRWVGTVEDKGCWGHRWVGHSWDGVGISGGSRISHRGRQPCKGGVDSRGSYVSKIMYVETKECGP